MAEQKIYLDFAGLTEYDGYAKKRMKDADAVVLQGAKDYADGLASNYDSAGTAQSKINELVASTGQVGKNTTAIALLNNADAEVEGSIAYSIAQAKGEMATEIGKVDTKANNNATAISNAQGEIDALELVVGDATALQTTAKIVVPAINELKGAIVDAQTAGAVSVTTDGTTAGMLKTYHIMQNNKEVGVIDIPKDMVVESGAVVEATVEAPVGEATSGTFIKLVLANVEEPLYINVAKLVDNYTAKAGATQIQLAIDSNRAISATVVAGSIGATELGANAVVTEKIADANVTKAKLEAGVQTSLGKADSAVQSVVVLGQTLTKDANEITAEQVKTALSLGSAAYVATTTFDVAGAAEGVKEELLGSASTDTDASNTIAGAKKYADAKKTEAVNTASADATSKANQALADAKEYANGLDTAMGLRVSALESVSFASITSEQIKSLFPEQFPATEG